MTEISEAIHSIFHDYDETLDEHEANIKDLINKIEALENYLNIEFKYYPNKYEKVINKDS